MYSGDHGAVSTDGEHVSVIKREPGRSGGCPWVRRVAGEWFGVGMGAGEQGCVPRATGG